LVVEVVSKSLVDPDLDPTFPLPLTPSRQGREKFYSLSLDGRRLLEERGRSTILL
jgi:hypothetical protein